MYTIVLCKDGVFRAKRFNSTMLLALEFLQDKAAGTPQSDDSFWKTHLSYPFLIEKGATVSSFFNALRPWGEYWSHFMNLDFQSYDEELVTPLAKGQTPSNLDYLMVQKYHDLDLETETHPEDGYSEGKDMGEWLNAPHRRRYNGLWSFETRLDVSGYKAKVTEHYSVSNTPMNQLKDVMLVMSPYWKMILPKTKDSVISPFNEQGFGLQSITAQHGDLGSYTVNFIQGRTEWFFEEVLHAFFGGFEYDVEDRDALNDVLQDRLSDAILQREETQQAEQDAHIQESLESEDRKGNVIAFPQKKVKPSEPGTGPTSHKTLEVVSIQEIMGGEDDSESLSEQQTLWNRWERRAKASKEPIRIGVDTSKAEEVDDRVLSYTNDKPLPTTDYWVS